VARGHTVRAVAFGDQVETPRDCELTRVSLNQPLPVRALQYARAYRRGAAWADVVYVTTLGLPRPPHSQPVVLRVPGDRAWERAVNQGLVPPSQDIDAFQRARVAPRVACMKWVRAREARRADRVLVPSEYLTRMVAGWGVDPSRLVVVHSAVPDSVAPSVGPEQARGLLGWSPDARYILTAARLTAWKGVDYLIDAVAHVPDVTLVVAGDGPEKAALVARAARAPSVSFVGALSREVLHTYIRAADYFALYSGYEGLPHVVLEALRAGTPVIVSDRGGNPEVVRDGDNGLLVGHPDLAALVAAGGRPRDRDGGRAASLDGLTGNARADDDAGTRSRGSGARVHGRLGKRARPARRSRGRPLSENVRTRASTKRRDLADCEAERSHQDSPADRVRARDGATRSTGRRGLQPHDSALRLLGGSHCDGRTKAHRALVRAQT
jgi:glycosyltransferase involved in cell wall biosynthesis